MAETWAEAHPCAPVSPGGAAEDGAPASVAQDDRLGEVMRFHRAERHLHWAIAVPFMLCYSSAAILVLVYNQNPGWPLRGIFSWGHRVSGICLILLPPLALIRHWRDFRLHLRNVRSGWRWTIDDLKWLALAGPAAFSPGIELPRQGKFNAGEKINFIAVMCAFPVYVATGLTIWFGGVPFVSWLIHVFVAAFVATPLLAGHLFMALVNPDTRVGLSGMLTGFVDRHWARHHYRHWYDETFGAAPEAEPPGDSPRLTTPASGASEDEAFVLGEAEC